MNKKHYSIAMTETVHAGACSRLLREDFQEDLCFALWYPSSGKNRQTALIERLILPESGDRKINGNVSFSPTYLDRAIKLARESGAGIALMHSHLGPGWQGMSSDDIVAESRHAPAIFGATGLPFIGLTIGTDQSWSGRFWEKEGFREYKRLWCESVRVVGGALNITFDEEQKATPIITDKQERTVSAWGEKCQADLARLKIGIVGVGSVGSIVAEALARTGISDILLIDFDLVESVNLDRLLHATKKDIGFPKVNVIARSIKKSSTSEKFDVNPVQASITEENAFRQALDCDVLFSCVDRPWPRYVLNLIAYAHLIPVVDGGIRATTTSSRKIRGADWRAHVVTPGRACLECLEQYDPALVTSEREGHLDDPRYIEGLANEHPIRRKENVFPFSLSLASLEILQMVSLIIRPAGQPDMGQKLFRFVLGELETKNERCRVGCSFSSKYLAKGDKCGLPIIGKHVVAEKARKQAGSSMGLLIARFKSIFH